MSSLFGGFVPSNPFGEFKNPAANPSVFSQLQQGSKLPQPVPGLFVSGGNSIFGSPPCSQCQKYYSELSLNKQELNFLRLKADTLNSLQNIFNREIIQSLRPLQKYLRESNELIKSKRGFEIAFKELKKQFEENIFRLTLPIIQTTMEELKKSLEWSENQKKKIEDHLQQQIAFLNDLKNSRFEDTKESVFAQGELTGLRTIFEDRIKLQDKLLADIKAMIDKGAEMKQDYEKRNKEGDELIAEKFEQKREKEKQNSVIKSQY